VESQRRERNEYTSGYCYRIVFDDHTSAVVDFSEFLDRGPVFVPLRNLESSNRHGLKAAPLRGQTARTSLRKRCTRSANNRRHAIMCRLPEPITDRSKPNANCHVPAATTDYFPCSLVVGRSGRALGRVKMERQETGRSQTWVSEAGQNGANGDGLVEFGFQQDAKQAKRGT